MVFLRTSFRFRSRITKLAKCAAKTVTFLICASLYAIVMKLTILKTEHAAVDKEVLPDENDTKLMNAWASNYLEKMPRSLLENMTAGEYDALLDEYDARLLRVHDACLEYNLTFTNGRVNSREFFVDDKHGLVWCNVFKAASSSWMYNFNLLGGYSEKFLSRTRQSPLTLARKKFPRPSERDVIAANTDPNTISFIIVREPFERLLSAFRDKLENHPHLYYRSLARSIVKKYRKKKLKTKAPTFQEFVQYLTDGYEARDDLSMDEHWTPYYKFCSPCRFQFKMVVKVETLERDNEFILRELGLRKILPRPAEKRTRVKTIMNKSRDGRNTTALLKTYFETIDRNMLQKLLNIYKIDFDMFGYDSEVYKQYVRN